MGVTPSVCGCGCVWLCVQRIKSDQKEQKFETYKMALKAGWQQQQGLDTTFAFLARLLRFKEISILKTGFSKYIMVAAVFGDILQLLAHNLKCVLYNSPHSRRALPISPFQLIIYF